MEKNTYTLTKGRSQNTTTILKLVCTGRATTRADIARVTGLSKMTVSNIVAELLEKGFFAEIGRELPGVSQGRKAIELEISQTAPCVVGIFIGRITCSVVVSTIDAHLIGKVSFDFPSGITEKQLLDGLYEMYKAQTENLNRKILGIGIASIGPLDTAQGTILNPPDFYGIKNIGIREFFRQKTGLFVSFDNNMRAAVLAEKLFGYGKETSNILYLGVTHGVGAGVIVADQLLDSPTGVNGEVGHTSIKFDGQLCSCGNRGCLEMYAGIPQITQSAVAEMESGGVAVPANYDWPKLVELARQGEYYSVRALKRLSEYLSVAIVNLVNLFDSVEVFLGHDIALAEGLIEQELEDIVNRRIFAADIKTVKIRMSYFGAEAPLIGSICLPLECLFNNQIAIDDI